MKNRDYAACGKFSSAERSPARDILPQNRHDSEYFAVEALTRDQQLNKRAICIYANPRRSKSGSTSHAGCRGTF